MNDRLEDFRINALLLSILLFAVIGLIAFLDYYQCSIYGVYRPIGVICINYVIPTVLAYLGSYLGYMKNPWLFSFSLIALGWLIFFTIQNPNYGYRLPF